MSQQTALNPYETPDAELVTVENSEIQFCSARGIKGKEGFSIVGDAWQIYKKSALMWTLVCITSFIVMVALSLIPILGQVATSLLMTPMIAGLYIGAEQVRNGEAQSVRFGHLFAAFKAGKGLRLVGFGLVYLVLYIAMMAAVLFAVGASDLLPLVMGQQGSEIDPPAMQGLLIGVLAMAVMGVFFTMIYWFAVPLITFQNQGMFEAMINSLKGCLKNIWPITLYGLAVMFWLFLGAIPVGLGLLVVIPVLYISAYTAYRRIYTE